MEAFVAELLMCSLLDTFLLVVGILSSLRSLSLEERDVVSVREDGVEDGGKGEISFKKKRENLINLTFCGFTHFSVNILSYPKVFG